MRPILSDLALSHKPFLGFRLILRRADATLASMRANPFLRPERLRITYALLFNLGLTVSAQPIAPTNGQVFTANSVLVPGTYNLPGGISIGASGITLDLNGAILVGSSFTNYGVTCIGHDNVVIKNGVIRGYYYGVRLENATGAQVLDNDLS